ARAWWLLRYAGLSRVYVLDGGLDAWRNADLPLQAGEVLPRIGSAYLYCGNMPVVDTEDIHNFVRERRVRLVARSCGRYTGDHEPIDPVARHVPGAVSAPSTALTDADGKFLPADALQDYFADYHASQQATVTAYCGSGVTASKVVLGLALAGVDAALYPGSWSAWSAVRDRSVATGEAAGTMPEDA